MKGDPETWQVIASYEIFVEEGEQRFVGDALGVVLESLGDASTIEREVRRGEFEANPASGSGLNFRVFSGDEAAPSIYDFAMRALSRQLDERGANPGDAKNVASSVADVLLYETRVPIYGSPPTAWETLGNLVASGTVTGGAIVTGAADSPASYLLIFGSSALLMKLIAPSIDATAIGIAVIVRRYWELQYGKLFGQEPDSEQR